MKYLWIAIGILLIVLFATKTVKRETFDNEPKQCGERCPVHGTLFDPPYLHALHYVNMDEDGNKVFECSKCHCLKTQTADDL